MIDLSTALLPTLLFGHYPKEDWRRRDPSIEADLRAARERARKRT